MAYTVGIMRLLRPAAGLDERVAQIHTVLGMFEYLQDALGAFTNFKDPGCGRFAFLAGPAIRIKVLRPTAR